MIAQTYIYKIPEAESRRKLLEFVKMQPWQVNILNGFKTRPIKSDPKASGGGVGAGGVIYLVANSITLDETARKDKTIYLSEQALNIIDKSLKFSLDSARRMRDISQGKEKSPINQRICELKRLIKYLNEN